MEPQVAKAQRLLAERLTRDELSTALRTGLLPVWGSEGGRYMVGVRRFDRGATLGAYYRDATYQVMFSRGWFFPPGKLRARARSFCVHTVSPHGYHLPAGDDILAIKWAIEGDEEAFLDAAVPREWNGWVEAGPTWTAPDFWPPLRR